MCPQPSLPVVPGDSAASRSSDRNEKPKTAKKPAIVLGPKKPTRKHALAPRPPDPVALQHPKRVDQKVYNFWILWRLANDVVMAILQEIGNTE